MCQYLYAAFSLKSTAGLGLRADQLEAVERWRRVIFAIAGEEMLHWAMVQNLLTAVGSAPYVSLPDMPHQAGGYPPGVQLRLLPFGEAALQHFVYLERPEGVERADGKGFEPAGPPPPPMRPEEVVPRGQDFATQGHLYRSIERASPAWLTSWARTGCSSGQPSSRPTRPPSDGLIWDPSRAWRAPTGRWSASWSKGRGHRRLGGRPLRPLPRGA